MFFEAGGFFSVVKSVGVQLVFTRNGMDKSCPQPFLVHAELVSLKAIRPAECPRARPCFQHDAFNFWLVAVELFQDGIIK